MNLLKRRIIEDHESQVGSHDDPRIYAEPAGDPGLIGPGSVSWRIHTDISAVTIAGLGAIVLEILHPGVMAGVGLQSNYREQPYRRAQTTFGWVMTTTFGSTPAAEGLIERVKRMHSRVNGVDPAGRPYRALDPELIAWVHSCIPWAVMTAYERYNQPLSEAEKDRYLDEQSVIGLMSGADQVPRSVAELDAFVEQIRPKLEVNDLTREFFDFLLGGPLGAVRAPGRLARPLKRFQVESGMSLMPPWAQQLAGFEHSELAQRLLHDPSMRSYARSLRWAFGTPAYRRLSDQRMGIEATETGAAGEPERAPLRAARVSG